MRSHHAAVIDHDTGKLRFIRIMYAMPNPSSGVLFGERGEGYPLEDVIGAYRTNDELNADLDRVLREADTIGDTRGLQHPHPITTPLCFVWYVERSPLTELVMRQSIHVHANEATRAFVARRPVFFGRLHKSLARGQFMTAPQIVSSAHEFMNECLKLWPDTHVSVKIEST